MLNNNFNGGTNIGSGNSAGRDQIINNYISSSSQEKQPIDKHDIEPIWRSPITMAVLTWFGFFSSLGSAFSIFKVFEPLFTDFHNSNQGYMLIFLGFFVITVIIFFLRSITSKQIRYPLMFNYALSGVNGRLNIEKIKVNSCPICNGKMKYYSKPVNWSIDGKVIKREPVLECKRNRDHFLHVDPAGTRIC